MQQYGKHKLILAYWSTTPHSDRHSLRVGDNLLVALIEVFEKVVGGNYAPNQLQILLFPLKWGHFGFDLVVEYSCHPTRLNNGVNLFRWPSCSNCQGKIRITPAQLAPALTERGVPVKVISCK